MVPNVAMLFRRVSIIIIVFCCCGQPNPLRLLNPIIKVGVLFTPNRLFCGQHSVIMADSETLHTITAIVFIFLLFEVLVEH